MLSKKNRVDKKNIDLIFKEGKYLASPNLNFKFLVTESPKNARISFISPKNIVRLAIDRNRIRRRGYTALAKYIDQFPAGLLGAFIFKNYQDDVKILESEIKNILDKIN